MQKITVKKVETKPGKAGVPGCLVIIHDEKDAKFSAFTNKVPDLDKVVSGDIIEADIQIDGKFANIISFKVLEHGATPAQPAASGAESSDMTKEEWKEKQRIERRSIERQTAAKLAVSTFVAGMFDTHQFNDRANAIYAWVSELTGPDKSIPTKAPVSAPPKTTSDEDFANLGEERERLDAAKTTEAGKKTNPASNEERLKVVMDSNGYNWGDVNAYVYRVYGVADWKRLTVMQYTELLTAVSSGKIEKARKETKH
jgi:hypothetical protein